MKLYMSDLYRVELHYPIDEIQNDILYYLYQPLLGTYAIGLYMTLVAEGKRMQRIVTPASLSRLISFMSMSLIDIEKNLRSLEAIGLLKTYVKRDEHCTQYIYQLQSPLSLKAFFKNQILTSLLSDSLSEDDFQKTIQYFKITLEDLHEYEEVTAKFQDVFTISHLQKKGRILKYNEDFKEKKTQDIETTYDLELLYKSLTDYQINRSKLSTEDIRYITQLATVYSVDALTLAGLVKDSMQSTGFNRDILKTNIKKYFEIDNMNQLKEVYHKQPLQYHTDGDHSPLVLHMKYLDSLTPYELLKDKQGGKEPVFHDLMIVEMLMVQLGLQPSVVNVLIEYVLGKNQNRLSKRYCEAIGASWARKNIHTAMDAYRELMDKEDLEPEENQIVQQQPIVVQAEQTDELMDLLSQLKEGQL
ncbi:DnaD domain protein [Candidatus Stoquefichus massiliensis]|uniref:DnaD domain protein n=1 Tax=Candidatus Stoquefichus massiliensis TaxID=1470350 RepID=UPI000488CC1B|nr:DnaD domain protein [Candidatus Stoquefichus massiliensis]